MMTFVLTMVNSGAVRVIFWSIVMTVTDKVLARAPLLDPDEIERNIEDMNLGEHSGHRSTGCCDTRRR